MQTEEEFRQDLTHVAHKLYGKGLVAGTNGNISIRMDTDTILTSPFGVSLGTLEPGQVIQTNVNGEVTAGQGQTSVEYPLHLEAYRRRSDVRAVIHAHPPVATGMAAAGLDMTEPLLTEVILGFGGIPLAPYAAPGTDAFVQAITDLVPDHNALLLANHGALTLGQTLHDACHKMEVLELVAQSTLTARLFGGAKPLSNAQAQELRSLRAKLSGRTPDPECTPCTEWMRTCSSLAPLFSLPTHCGACAECTSSEGSGGSGGAAQASQADADTPLENLIRQVTAKVVQQLG